MDFLYVFLNGSDWEDMIILVSKEDAINESIKHPNARVEIFTKNKTSKYIPSYNYYKNGQLIQN